MCLCYCSIHGQANKYFIWVECVVRLPIVRFVDTVLCCVLIRSLCEIMLSFLEALLVLREARTSVLSPVITFATCSRRVMHFYQDQAKYHKIFSVSFKELSIKLDVKYERGEISCIPVQGVRIMFLHSSVPVPMVTGKNNKLQIEKKCPSSTNLEIQGHIICTSCRILLSQRSS